MPTYEYQCNDCKKTFSIHLTIAEHEKTPMPKCEYCGSANVEQLLSGVTVITSRKS